MIYIPAILLVILIFIFAKKPKILYSNNNKDKLVDNTNKEENKDSSKDNTNKDNTLLNMFANLCSGSNKKLYPIDGVPINKGIGEACYCSTRMYNVPP